MYHRQTDRDMILTDYYRFDKLDGIKSKLRLDCVSSTASYNPLEALRNKRGELFVYLGTNTYTKAGRDGKTDLALGHGDSHISSVYVPDVTLAAGVGDMIHTADALVFVFTDFTMIDGHPSAGTRCELFVARGQRRNLNGIYTLVCDGQLDTEMQGLRERAQPEAARLPK